MVHKIDVFHAQVQLISFDCSSELRVNFASFLRIEMFVIINCFKMQKSGFMIYRGL